MSAPHLLHLTSVGAVIFQFALLLSLLPLEDLFLGQMDISYTSLLKPRLQSLFFMFIYYGVICYFLLFANIIILLVVMAMKTLFFGAFTMNLVKIRIIICDMQTFCCNFADGIT